MNISKYTTCIRQVKYPNRRRDNNCKNTQRNTWNLYPNNLKINMIKYPKSILKSVDEMIIIFRKYTQNMQDDEVILKNMLNNLLNEHSYHVNN